MISHLSILTVFVEKSSQRKFHLVKFGCCCRRATWNTMNNSDLIIYCSRTIQSTECATLFGTILKENNKRRKNMTNERPVSDCIDQWESRIWPMRDKYSRSQGDKNNWSLHPILPSSWFFVFEFQITNCIGIKV